jgi:alpha-amylase
MPDSVVIYTVVHQPRRPRLPAATLSWDMSATEMAEAIFDAQLNRRYLQKVARYCYYPAIAEFRRHLDRGLKLSIGFSFSFLRQAQLWEPHLMDDFRDLVSHPNVELIGVEPYHSFLFWLDFRRRMAWMRDELEHLFGKRPTVTDTTEMILSPAIYCALESAGFRGVLTEGRSHLLEWRSPNYLYAAQGHRMQMLTRHVTLSDDVGYRFSDRSWDGFPLRATDYVRWLRDADGDVAVIGWDFETFGEHHSVDSGIFGFLDWLPGELAYQGVQPHTASEALDRFGGRAHTLDLPVSPITWAGQGTMAFFLGNPVQQRIFHLMRHAYHLAALSDEPELLDIALWLAQSDNLHLLQWYQESSSDAEVSAYFTPDEWWRLGHERLPRELIGVYSNVVNVISERLARRRPRPTAVVLEAERGRVDYAPAAGR